MDRRRFLKLGVQCSMMLAAAPGMAAGAASNAASLPKRPYGDTGVELSIIGFGGVVVMNAEQDDANRVVAEAVERGVNYFDVAPGYGNAEEKLGPALEPYRKNVFLACKTAQRERATAEKKFENSLKVLRTDHFDLYQLHNIADMEDDVKPVFAKGGVFDMMRERHKTGQIRFLGFSSHTVEGALYALDQYDFDSVLFPVNFASWFKNGFGPQVVEKAREKGVARLALKAMARQQWPDDHPQRKTFEKCWYEPLIDPEEAALALRWTLSQPVTAAIPPGEAALFRHALDVATSFTPITEEETDLDSFR
jgi:aryl-alcohol dehydrogenase-like predicted oxidoreductase